MGTRERGLAGALGLAAAVVGFVAGADPAAPAPAGDASAIPAFSRIYRTSCSTCHLAPPKLNVLGEAFRLAGYRFPDNDALLRDEEPVPLGAEAWEDEWPRAIWPGELPAIPPLAVRIVNDVRWTADETEPSEWTYDFPAEIHLVAATSLGEEISALGEIHWDPDEEVEVSQAKVRFGIPFDPLPERALHLSVGKQNLRLLSFADPQLDRIARERFLWQSLDEADLGVPRAEADDRRSVGPPLFQPSIEVDGIVARRWTYGIGLATGDDRSGEPSDAYWRLAYKLGGLDYEGHYDGDGPVRVGEGGQLFDRSLVLEHFGYVGETSDRGGVTADRWSWGAAARWMVGAWELGGGYVQGESDPSGLASSGGYEWESAFGRLEWFAWPWLVASLKAETFGVDLGPDEPVRSDRTRILPGVVALVRPNVRAVAEASLWIENDPADRAGAALPHALWVRLDVAF